MNKKFILCGVAAASITTFSKPISIYVEPFFTGIDYHNSKFKKDGYSTTLYGSVSLENGVHLFEGAYGYTHLNYKNLNTNWNQNDYVIAYTNYQLFPWYFKIGYHYIASPNTDISKSSNTFFVDLGWIKKYAYSYGIFLSYSKYRRKVSTVELRPHAGFYYWLDFYRGFYYSIDGTWIRINNQKNIGVTQKNYFSLQGSITYFTPQYSLGLSLWGGKRTFMVDNGGFVIYNLRERYKYGVNLNGRYYFNRRVSVGVQFGYNKYKELSTNKNVSVFTSTVSVGFSF